jgi:hypothetical protein
MKLAVLRIAAIAIWVMLVFAPLLQVPAEQLDSQQRIAQLKHSLADNQAKLKHYQWIETTEVIVKGNTKKEQQQLCHYGADGRIEKTPIGPAPAQQSMPGGIRGKIAQKKLAEMQSYMERLKSLVGHYAPPDPEKLQAAKRAGNAGMDLSAGQATLMFRNYYKPGDMVSFAFDTTAKKLRSYNVNTYLDDPKSDIVTLENRFADLPNGTNYLRQTVLDSKGKQIQIRMTNSDYGPAGQ